MEIEMQKHTTNKLPTHDFIIGPVDTDSISFCKSDMSPMSREEIDLLIKEINNISPEYMVWADDGYYEFCGTLKAKNYILYDGKKITIKGSGIKDQKRPQKHRDFYNDIIDSLINNRTDYTEIYNKYIKEILTLKDIKPWCTKKTYTEKIDTSERANETKVKDALLNSDYRPGDKLWVFYKKDKSLCLSEKFNGEYDEFHLLKGLYTATKIFANVIDVDKYFINYSLKKNGKLLCSF